MKRLAGRVVVTMAAALMAAQAVAADLEQVYRDALAYDAALAAARAAADAGREKLPQGRAGLLHAHDSHLRLYRTDAEAVQALRQLQPPPADMAAAAI